MRSMRLKLPGHDDLVRNAEQAVKFAGQTRRRLRRRTHRNDPTRKRKVHDALHELESAMKPLRSAMGKVQWTAIDERSQDELQTASRRLQYERRQLKRML